MKNHFLLILILAINLFSIPAMSQSENEAGDDTEALGLPGDNLDLYAVLDLFQKSKTIEDFEKALNEENAGINNLDLNLDDKVDFIKVVTEQKDEDFSFVLQVDIGENEIQDVAVILVSKDKEDKVIMQIVGDKDLYGKDYVIEPKPPVPSVTANPAYTGSDPVVVESTTVVVVQSAPIVQYVYSPVYVPYYPPYYYGYYPPYFRPAVVVGVAIYRSNNYYHHNGYHGGHGNTVVVHNHNTYNNYNNTRNTSNTVNRNNSNGNYNRNTNSRPSNGSSTRPSTGQNKSGSAANRASTGQNKASTTKKPATSSQSRASSTATRPTNSSTRSNQSSSRHSTNSSYGSRSSGSAGASRSGGGAARSGGGGRRR
ncbi:MAG: hypothetical protein ACJAQ4_001528 [Cryomorphaceae bacterium]|jgi:hypothetical protein